MLHRFLDFELDEECCELRSDGQVVATQRRVFDLIVHLLHQRDRVVSRDELMNALWQGNVVSDAAISQVIMLARKALRDEGESQRVIKTVRGRGIRFVAQVESQHLERRASQASAPRASTPPEPVVQLVPHTTRQPLLGRGSELSKLRARLASAELGQGSLLLIEGEPGIGKTTLAEEIAREAQERDFTVIWGRSWEDGGAPPFWPWIQVLRSIAQREGAESLRTLLGNGAGELLPLLPEFGVAPEQRSELLAQDVDGARARFRQFDMMSLLLRHSCGRTSTGGLRNRPWLVIIEDLHAADEASVQLIRFLMPELSELGLFLLCTYRGFAADHRSALATLAEGAGEHVLRLRGLDDSDVYHLIARALPGEPRAHVVSMLHALSSGNPLLLSELCRRLDPDRPEALLELSHLSAHPLPERIAGAIRRHLEELPAATRHALTVAAALGREFSPQLLAELLEVEEPALLPQLTPALKRGMLRPATTAGRLLFSHALVCSAIYGELSPEERPSLHRRIGALLERQSEGADAPVHELAHHYYLAAGDGDRDKALEFAVRAAAQARAVMAHEASAVLYDRAVSLAEQVRAPQTTRYDYLCRAGEAWYRAGERERAVARYDRAVRVARVAGDAQRFAESVWLLCCVHSKLRNDAYRHGLIVEALAWLPCVDSSARARLLGASALAEDDADTFTVRERASSEAVQMARRLGDSETLLCTLNARHMLLWGAVPTSETVDIAREAVELSERIQDVDLVMHSWLWLAVNYIEQGDLPNLMRVHQRYVAALGRDSGPFHRHMVVGAKLLESWMMGDLSGAREHARRMLALGRQVQNEEAEAYFTLQTLFLDRDQGVPRSLAASPFEVPPWPASISQECRVLFALEWAERGYTEAARTLLRQTLHQPDVLQEPLRRPALAVLAQASVVLEDRAAMRQIYDLLASDRDRHMVLQACVYMGPVDHYLGIVAAGLGDLLLASSHYERAIASAMSIVRGTEIRYQYGRLLSRLPERRAEAEEHLTTAASNARRLGMSAVRAYAEGALSDLSERRSPSAG